MAAASCLAHADDSPWRVYVAGGISTGGEALLSGTIVGHGTNKTVPFDIRPGTGIPLRLGAQYRTSNPFALRASVERTVSDPMGYIRSAASPR